MFDGKYFEWNQKRIKCIVDFYGHKFFHLKKVLDLGCGYGDLGGVLYRLGADVTAVDVRQEHLKIVSKKFSGIKIIKANLDGEWPFINQKFDLVLSLGLLCHLGNYEHHIRTICAATTNLVLETAVCDSQDPQKCVIVDQDREIYDQAYGGKGCYPSALAIEKVLTECGMSFKRIDHAKLNTLDYQYDWRPNNDDSTNPSKRKIWFCVKDGNTSVKPTTTSAFTPPPRIREVREEAKHRANRNPNPPPALPPVVKNTSKIRLFYNYYEEKDPARKQEIDLCLQNNINNPYFDIIVLDCQERPTYDFFFKKINQLVKPDDISIFCNTDVFFDNSITLASRVKEKEVFALSSWTWQGKNQSNVPSKDNSQDAWIVRGKIENVFGDFPIGLNHSDNRLAHEFSKAGYILINPSKTIKVTHVHNSNIRNYTETDIVEGPYLGVPIIGF